MKKIIIILITLLLMSLHLFAETTQIIPPVIVKRKTVSLTSGSASIISQQDIITSGFTSLSQALQNLGGVQLQDISGNNNQVLLSLRGFGANASSNTLLLINGIPIINPDLAPPDLNAIPINQIHSITITAGSESILYGDQAVGGVIDIKTALPSTSNYLFSCLGGSYNQVTCSIAMNHFYKQLQYNLMINHNQTDNYREHNDYRQDFFSATALYPFNNGKLRLFLNAEKETMQFPGALTAQQVRQNRRQATNNTDFFTDKNGLLHLQWIQDLSPIWQLRFNASQRQMTGNGVLSTPFTQDRMTDFVKPELAGNIGDWTLINGLEWQQDHYDLNSSFGDTNNDQQKYAAYSLGNLAIRPSFHLSLGVRGALQEDELVSSQQQDSLNRAFVTTLGMSYTPVSEWNFYLRRAGNYRFPKADENVTAPMGVNGLKTQHGESYETGFDMQMHTYSVKAQIYQLNLQDEIAFDPTQTPEQPFGSNRNLPPTVRRGLSLSGKEQITDNIQLASQINLVKAIFQNGINSGNRIPLVSEAIIHGGINYAVTDNWQIYSEALFTGNQFTANDDGNVGIRIGGYTIYNANLRYTHKQFSASLHINNIFNKYYYFYTVYQPGSPDEFFYPAPDRNLTLSLRYAI